MTNGVTTPQLARELQNAKLGDIVVTTTADTVESVVNNLSDPGIIGVRRLCHGGGS